MHSMYVTLPIGQTAPWGEESGGPQGQVLAAGQAWGVISRMTCYVWVPVRQERRLRVSLCTPDQGDENIRV